MIDQVVHEPDVNTQNCQEEHVNQQQEDLQIAQVGTGEIIPNILPVAPVVNNFEGRIQPDESLFVWGNTMSTVFTNNLNTVYGALLEKELI